jgi:hypothetical protein
MIGYAWLVMAYREALRRSEYSGGECSAQWMIYHALTDTK